MKTTLVPEKYIAQVLMSSKNVPYSTFHEGHLGRQKNLASLVLLYSPMHRVVMHNDAPVMMSCINNTSALKV